MNYNKNIFLENVYYLINESKLKIGEVENKCGLSTGYFSRLKNDENVKAGPNIDCLIKLCEMLNVDLTILTTSDIQKMTDNEKIICSFLKFILDETRHEKIIWEKYSVINDKELIDFPELKIDDESLCSLFSQERYTMDNNFYIADIHGKKFLYISLWDANYDNFGSCNYILAERNLYVIGSQLSKFSYGIEEKETVIDGLMENLENTIIEFTSKNRLTKDIADFAKSILNKQK